MPIGYAGTKGPTWQWRLPPSGQSAKRGRHEAQDQPSTDQHAVKHDNVANQLLQQFSDLAATRLLHTLAQKLKLNSPLPFAPCRRGTDPSSASGQRAGRACHTSEQGCSAARQFWLTTGNRYEAGWPRCPIMYGYPGTGYPPL